MSNNKQKPLSVQPRLIRFSAAPTYVGMDRTRFNQEVRPFLTEIPIGKQGIAFDRLEIDAWVEDYKSRIGRPGRLIGEMTWDVKDRQVSSNETESGISTSASVGSEFAKVLAVLTSKKLSGS
jgi:predicted DNA-binding transcriptional regulator AlpA